MWQRVNSHHEEVDQDFVGDLGRRRFLRLLLLLLAMSHNDVLLGQLFLQHFNVLVLGRQLLDHLGPDLRSVRHGIQLSRSLLDLFGEEQLYGGLAHFGLLGRRSVLFHLFISDNMLLLG